MIWKRISSGELILVWRRGKWSGMEVFSTERPKCFEKFDQTKDFWPYCQFFRQFVIMFFLSLFLVILKSAPQIKGHQESEFVGSARKRLSLNLYFWSRGITVVGCHVKQYTSWERCVMRHVIVITHRSNADVMIWNRGYTCCSSF